jgi:hypothetical protein
MVSLVPKLIIASPGFALNASAVAGLSPVNEVTTVSTIDIEYIYIFIYLYIYIFIYLYIMHRSNILIDKEN